MNIVYDTVGLHVLLFVLVIFGETLETPTYSPPKLMQCFEQFGQLSGSKIYIGKTQLPSYNHNQPEEIDF